MVRYLSILLLVIFTFFNTILFSQTWVDMLHDPEVNFYTLQQEFEEHWANRDMEKGKGWKQFKRLEDFIEPRVYPSGDRALASSAKAYEEFTKYLLEQPESNRMTTHAWTPLGPIGAPTNGGGAGRINYVRFHPTNTNIIYAGAPAGGLWQTTNGGTSWITNTDGLTVIGNTDIAVDPTNPSILYMATGDGDGSDNYSIGILKSTDGGITWAATGLSWTVDQKRVINRLLINPSNPSVLLAGTSLGIYRTTDAGITWTLVSASNGIKDMEFKPGDPNTIYATSKIFLRSTDGGATFTQITSGLPGSASVRRFAIAVTPHDANYVYLLAGKDGDNGFLGVYRSINSGTAFTTQATSPNLLGWSTDGSDAGGQAWYDLAIAASPVNKNIIAVGGVNIWMSTNGGSTWSLNAHWYGGGGKPYVHADIHDLIFLPNGDLYAGTDGGVFKTTNLGSSWTDISSNIENSQMYKLGLSASDPGLILTGHQDNGTNRLKNGSWARVVGGDGMECFIDRTNNNIMFAELYYGRFRRSTNGGQSWNNITSGLVGEGAWVTPWLQDPIDDSVLYAGYSEIYKSTNKGTTWNQLGSVGGSGTFRSLAVAPSNNQVIYAARLSTIYKSTNGGSSWSNITSGLPGLAITYIAVHPTDPNTLFITLSGYSAGNKVFTSSNGGSNWTNISSGLPNLPVNCFVYQTGSISTIYVGTDVGVYAKDNSIQNWIPYFTGLPNVVVRELEIYYPTGKLRAATYGRGLWECDLFDSGNNPPLAEFEADVTEICPGATVQFTDESLFAPTNWFWTFQGGTPATSNNQNPTVTYPNPGTYQVTLITTNNNGSDTLIKTTFITVNSSLNLPYGEGFQGVQFLPAGWQSIDGGADSVTWEKSITRGGFGTSTSSTYMNNFTYDTKDTKDEIISPAVNLYGLDSVVLAFDVAYAQYSSSYSDTLNIEISTDCGNTWSSVYLKGGSSLATAPDKTTIFIPTAGQWRTDSIILDNYVGSSTVMIKFQNIGGYGNVLFLDNINITGTISTAMAANFSASQTIICEGTDVSFTDLSTGSPTSWSWSFPGAVPDTSNLKDPVVNYTTPGTHAVQLKVSNGLIDSTVIINSYITVNPAPQVVAAGTATICADTSTVISVSGANNYSWSPGGLTANSLTVSPKSTTTYTVTGYDNGCMNTDSVTITVNPVPDLIVTPAKVNVCEGDSTTLLVSGADNYTWAGTDLNTNSGNTVIASPANTTIYTVTGSSTAGCVTTKSVEVKIIEYPVVSFTPSNPTLCKGDTIDIQALGADFYTWAPLNGLTPVSYSFHKASPGVTTSYTVTGVTSGCSSSASFTISVVDPIIPVVTVNGNLLSTDPADSIQWNLNGVPIDSANNTTLTLADSGSYTVTIMDANGCISTSEAYYHTTTGIQETGVSLFNIYPNPNTGKFEIDIYIEQQGDYSIEVRNVLGQRIYNEDLRNFSGPYQKRLDLGHKAKGTYLISLKGKNGEVVKRVIVF